MRPNPRWLRCLARVTQPVFSPNTLPSAPLLESPVAEWEIMFSSYHGSAQLGRLPIGNRMLTYSKKEASIVGSLSSPQASPKIDARPSIFVSCKHSHPCAFTRTSPLQAANFRLLRSFSHPTKQIRC